VTQNGSTTSFPVTSFPLNNAAMVALGAPSGTLALSAGVDKTGAGVKPYFSGGVPSGNPITLLTGANTCPGGCDPAGRPVAPALFCTDITNANTNNGDWQIAGGMGQSPHFVSGTWKSATTTVNAQGVPSTTVDADPAKNITKTKNPVTWFAGPDAEPPLGGYETLANSDLESYGAEIRWNVNLITCNGQPLQAGHVYRVQFLVHDGDQNNAGGDSAQSCAIIALP
jgi:hypothetical protein